jgi:hypothetical protein
MILWIKDSLKEDGIIDFKILESYKGFLIYISRTYPSITPYLKGIYITLDSWRPWRDEKAWKLPLSEIKAVLDERSMSSSLGLDASAHDKPPTKVK